MGDVDDIFKLAMIQKLVNYDWNRPTHNLFTAFFDDAITILAAEPSLIEEFNKREKAFIQKYGLTIAQAEIRIYQRMTGKRSRLLVHKKKRGIDTYGIRTAPTNNRVIVSWYDMVDELRRLKVWTIQQIKNVSEQMELQISI